MKYLEKYNRYIDNDCVIYRKDKEGKLVQVKPSVNNCGYEFICYASPKIVYVHRLVYEAFKGEIPEGLEIDHIDGNKHNNNPDNLRVVTRKENMCNPVTITKLKRTKSEEEIKKMVESLSKPKSDFGKKYFEYYGYSKRINPKQYANELYWYCSHGKKCRWE